jgi:uncharacterized protein (UPF0332 family)
MQNRKANIEAELGRAKESFASAKLLLGKGFFNDCVSRLSYHTFRLVKALLLTKGLEPKTHNGALQLLGLHFIKKGILSPADSHVFARHMKYREEADYNSASMFTEEDAETLVQDALDLEAKIMACLRGGTYVRE